mmetsp:Transcript_19333/g.33253  ORF Transcript_19333/g.33253 Transcript_19333/m.33253 type:complete len:258 (+) Transcript_19333:127-900(+)
MADLTATIAEPTAEWSNSGEERAPTDVNADSKKRKLDAMYAAFGLAPPAVATHAAAAAHSAFCPMNGRKRSLFASSEGPSASGEQAGHHSSEYWNRRKEKLDEQAPKPLSSLFQGVVVYFDGKLDGELSAYQLTKLLQSHGGRTMPNLMHSKVTHIVCRNLSGIKTEGVIKRLGTRWSINVVAPEWILDSCNASRLLPVHSYTVIRDKGIHDLRLMVKDADRYPDVGTRSAGNTTKIQPSSLKVCHLVADAMVKRPL